MIHCVIGTRAQLIKMAPVLLGMESKGWNFNLLYTGQHSESFLEIYHEFGIKQPLHKIYRGHEVKSILRMGLWIASLLKTIIFKQIELFENRNPENDVVVVHGDTFSTLLGALIGKRYRMKVAHIESGLRSFNLLHPFPEEITRILTFKLADIAFCPDEKAINNLKNYSRLELVNTRHNTIVDALAMALSKLSSNHEYPVPQIPYGVISIHRFENIFNQEKFSQIIAQLRQISDQYHLIFVMHPATKLRLAKTGLINELKNAENIELRERTTYFNFIKLLANSSFVITDGGSNQEELSYLEIPTFLMRKTTERQEGLERNVVIGDYSEAKLKNFINEIPKQKPAIFNVKSSSPSKIIIEKIEPFSKISG